MRLLKEKDGTYSWRKILTALAAVIFAFACIGFTFGLPELPGSYQAIIAAVFTYYFMKDVGRNIKITGDNLNQPPS